MVAPPVFTPEAWRALPAYTRLIVLQQRDHDPARKQAIATHLASLAPYASAGADGPAAALITQHYAAEDARAGQQPDAATAAVEKARRILAEAEQAARAVISGAGSPAGADG